MMPGQTSSLQLPSFLHGTFRSVRQKAKREGLRCGEQYQKDGTFLLCQIKVPDMAQMNDVKDPVALNDLFAFFLKVGDNLRKAID